MVDLWIFLRSTLIKLFWKFQKLLCQLMLNIMSAIYFLSFVCYFECKKYWDAMLCFHIYLSNISASCINIITCWHISWVYLQGLLMNEGILRNILMKYTFLGWPLTKRTATIYDTVYHRLPVYAMFIW